LQLFPLAKRVWLALLVLFCGIYLYGLGSLPLVGSDEPRYAQVAREMFIRGDLVTPTLGGHTWFEKPALLYWLMMASYRLFGVTEFAARFGPAVCGLLTILIVIFVTRRVRLADGNKDSSHEILAGLITASCIGLVAFSRGASFDIVVTMTLTATLGCFILADIEADPGKRRLYLLGFFTGIGLSLLAKGLVGIVVPGGVTGLFFLLQRKWPAREYFTSLLWGAPVTALIAGTWYGPVISHHGWLFINEFFIQHHFARYVSDKYHHSEPVYYYLLVVWLLVLPWIAYVAGGLTDIVKQRFSSSSPLAKLDIFAFAWIVFPIVFFSLSGSKLPGYILPAVPGAAILAARKLSALEGSASSRWHAFLTSALLFSLAVGSFAMTKPLAGTSLLCAMLVAVPLAIAGIGAIFLARRPVGIVTLTCSAWAIAIVVAIRCVAPAVVDQQSMKRPLEEASKSGFGTTPVVEMHTIERTTEFYAGDRLMRAPDGEVLKLEGVPQLVEIAGKKNSPLLVVIPVSLSFQLTSSPDLDSRIISSNEAFAVVAVSLK
jgi:4-amino-4-deoxy-L-arabinose transferase-like glycosyltransferase